MHKTVNGLPVKVRLKVAARPPHAADSILTNSRAISNHRLAARLADSTLFREFQRAFEAATSLPLTLRAVESW